MANPPKKISRRSVVAHCKNLLNKEGEIFNAIFYYRDTLNSTLKEAHDACFKLWCKRSTK